MRHVLPFLALSLLLSLVVAAPVSGQGAFGGRQKKRNLRAEGGGQKTQRTADMGLEWLMRNQRDDGSWAGGGDLTDEAATSLALLAFLGAGETHKHGQYRDIVGQGFDWLTARRTADGWFVPTTAKRRFRDHATVTLAFAEAFGLTGSPRYRDPAVTGVRRLLDAARKGALSSAEDIVWFAMACKGLKASGLYTSTTRYDVFVLHDIAKLPAITEPRDSAMVLLARIFAGADPRKSQKVQDAVNHQLSDLPVWDEEAGSIDMRRWYFGTLAIFTVGGDAWKRWNDAMKVVIIDQQRRKGEEAGSWDPMGVWTKRSGRVAATALMVMCVEVYYRYGRVFGTKGGSSAPSTGGTREPNGRPYGDTFFEHHGVNPFVDTEDDALSTFALDVDTASYAVARRFLTDGNLPETSAVRTEEFVNSFPSDDPAPTEGVFGLAAEGMPSPFGGKRCHLLRIGLRAKDVEPAERKPACLTFVVDVSGSMASGNRLGLVRRSLRLLVSKLREGDRIGLVVYGDHGRVLLSHTPDRQAILDAVDHLVPDGATNADEGLRKGYRLAAKAFMKGRINRVILCSDGVANMGRTKAESILKVIAKHAEKGIEISTLGFGMGNYNDVLMEKLADRGNGNYAYIDTFSEARRIFMENLTGMLQTVAWDAKVQVAWNPEVVSRYRLLGYENRALADEEFEKDDVDAGEIGAGHSVTALYEIKLHREAREGPLGSFRIRYRAQAKGGETVTEKLALPGETLTGKPSRYLKLAAGVAEFAEILRGSYWAKESSCEAVAEYLAPVLAEYDHAPRVVELLDLVNRSAALGKADD